MGNTMNASNQKPFGQNLQQKQIPIQPKIQSQPFGQHKPQKFTQRTVTWAYTVTPKVSKTAISRAPNINNNRNMIQPKPINNNGPFGPSKTNISWKCNRAQCGNLNPSSNKFCGGCGQPKQHINRNQYVIVQQKPNNSPFGQPRNTMNNNGYQ